METRILDLAAAAIAGRLSSPARILRVVRGGPRQIWLHLEWRDQPQRGALCADVAPGQATFHLLPLSRARAEEAEAGILERIQGGSITGIETGPEPRIRRLKILGRPGGEARDEWTLVLEWTGGSGNILLLDSAGNVIETLLFGGSLGTPYRPPLRGAKPAPEALDEDALAPLLAPLPAHEWPRILVRECRGLSVAGALDAVLRGHPSAAEILKILRQPPLPEAILYRFPRRAAIAPPQGIASGTGPERNWTPALLGLPAAEVTNRPMPSLESFADPRSGDVLELLARRYDILQESAEREGQRAEMQKRIHGEVARMLRLRRHLLAERETPETGQRLRRSGEEILSHLGQIRKGSERFECPDWTDPAGERTLSIDLDPAKTPVENAQIYFHKARRWERGEPHRRRRLEAIDSAVSRLSLLRTWAAETESIPRPSAIRLRLDEALGVLKTRRHSNSEETAPPAAPARPAASSGRDQRHARGPASTQGAQFRPRVYTTREGWTVLVGRSNAENDYLTHRLAHAEDYWFHVHGVPGSHVVLRRAGRKDNPSARTLEEVAGLTAFYSKARNSGKVPVIYTLKKYVRKPRGAKPGLAVCQREKTLLVTPRDPMEGQEPEWMEE